MLVSDSTGVGLLYATGFEAAVIELTLRWQLPWKPLFPSVLWLSHNMVASAGNFFVAAAVRQSSTLFWRDGCLRNRRAWFYFDIPSWSTKSAPWCPAVLDLLHSVVPSCMQFVPSSCAKMCPAFYIQQASCAWPLPSSCARCTQLCLAFSIQWCQIVLSLFHPAVLSLLHAAVPSCAQLLPSSYAQTCMASSIQLFPAVPSLILLRGCRTLGML